MHVVKGCARGFSRRAQVRQAVGRVRSTLGLKPAERIGELAELRLKLVVSARAGAIIVYDEQGSVERVEIRGDELIERFRRVRHRAEAANMVQEPKRQRYLVLSYMREGRAVPWWSISSMVEHLRQIVGQFWVNELLEEIILGADVTDERAREVNSTIRSRVARSRR